MDFEIEVVQSTALGAISLWQAAESYRIECARPIELPKLLLVLPIVFHRNSAASVARLQLASGLLKAINDEPMILAGLQERVKASAERTYRSLALAIGGGFLERLTDSNTWPVYESRRRGLPAKITMHTERERRILAASKRLGHWFASADTMHLALQLGVHF